jgi:pimeloyl-ACP methyl ester carboxylesterase
MLIEIAPQRRLFVDIQGPSLVPDGSQWREKPTLLLLHGGPGFDHSTFKPAFDAMADVAQIVYYDHRGHGRSDPCPSDEWTLDVFADDVVRLCDALGVSKPIVLGQSFGGFVAQRYLQRHPQHAQKVILSSTSPHLGLARKLAMFDKLGGAPSREAARAFWQQPSALTWPPYQALCSPLYNTHPQDPAAKKRQRFNMEILFASASGEQQAMNLLPGLALAACPVLVLAGEDDPVCPIDDARDIAAALPPEWVSFVGIANAGHGTWRDQPAQAFAALRAFIQA